MQRTAGLRTEIIVNIALLMGAALLFAGFLLLKLTERELVEQRIKSVIGTMEILSRTLSPGFQGARSIPEDLLARAEFLLRPLCADFCVEAWGMVDRNLVPLASQASIGVFQLERTNLNRVRYTGEPTVKVHYPTTWLPFGEREESFVVVTAPVVHRSEFAGALQARFSLADVRQRVLAAQKLVFLYVVLYGAVLVLFGVHLLSHTVVVPVKRLRQMTQQVAAGDLGRALAVKGPREIADLSRSFNTMTAALRKSREESQAHIVSLKKTNEDLKRTQEELIRSEKMASVGHLAAGMAHEIGNPLGAVVGYLEFLKTELPSGGSKDIAERALAETERIDRLVKDLLDYAAPAASEPEMLDPAAVMAEARDILFYQGIFEALRLESKLPSVLPSVVVVRHKLLQVFVNLLLNARDASSKGGSIRLLGGEEGQYVWLSVADEGPGMSPEVLTHIFDPFYTTKAPGKGRGLGLSVCHRVVEEAGGKIEVRSAAGQGSVFTIRLKKAEPASNET